MRQRVRKYNIKPILSGKPHCNPLSFPKCAALRLITHSYYLQSLTAIWTRTSFFSSCSFRSDHYYPRSSSLEYCTFQRAYTFQRALHLPACQQTANLSAFICPVCPFKDPTCDFSTSRQITQEPSCVRLPNLALLKIFPVSFQRHLFPREPSSVHLPDLVLPKIPPVSQQSSHFSLFDGRLITPTFHR